MNKSYYDLLNEFYDLLQCNPPSQSAQLLYHTLLMINNKCGWIEWFQRTNINICAMIGINEKSFRKCRNELKQLGLIDFISSKKKGESTKYKILGLGGKKYPLNDPLTSPLTDPLNDPLMYRHNKTKEIDIEKESSSSKLEELNKKDKEEEKQKDDDDISKVFKTYQENISPLPSVVVYKELKNLLNDVEPGVIIKAIEIAVLNNARSFNYIKRILEEWICNGLTTKQAVELHLKTKGSKKSSNATQAVDKRQQEFEARLAERRKELGL